MGGGAADRGPVFDGVRIGRPATGALVDAGYHSLADLPDDLDALLPLHGVGPRAVRLLADARVPVDPNVAPIEQILEAAAGPPVATPGSGGRAVAEHALWVCASITFDDAPTWLVHDLPGGGLAWCRLPDGVEADDVVDARLLTGAHVDPSMFLSWLRGESSARWYEPFGIDDDVVPEVLGARLRGPDPREADVKPG